MKNYFIFFIVLLILILTAGMTYSSASFTNYVAPYAPKSQAKWWTRAGWERFGFPYYSYWENFENLNDRPAELQGEGKSDTLLSTTVGKESVILEYPPDTPGPAALYNNQPYHLLEDSIPPPRMQEALSCVNSRSCYATDFERMITKTGNFRQLTNNYKRGYPDSCSAPYQELVLNFYKADVIPAPPDSD